MAISLYDVSIPVMIRGLGILSEYMEKASVFATESDIDPSIILNARLFPDMMSLTGQVQRASDNAKGAVGRLTGVEIPVFPDRETTFVELKERVAKTIAFLRTVTRDQIERGQDRIIETKFRGTMRGETYVLQHLLPNFFFHVATAHDILRHNGLKIGKKDYLGPLDAPEAR